MLRRSHNGLILEGEDRNEIQAFPLTVTPVTVSQHGYGNTFFCLNWVYLTVKTTGYSDTPLIVTRLANSKGVIVSKEVCINIRSLFDKLNEIVWAEVLKMVERQKRGKGK